MQVPTDRFVFVGEIVPVGHISVQPFAMHDWVYSSISDHSRIKKQEAIPTEQGKVMSHLTLDLSRWMNKADEEAKGIATWNSEGHQRRWATTDVS